MIIAFDFDGTITKENNYPYCNELREGIVNCINKLHKDDHSIMIFTCRDTQHYSQVNAYMLMLKCLADNNIKFDVINRNLNPTRQFNPIKPYWDILVDDSALGWNPDWTGDQIYDLIQSKIILRQTNKITHNHDNRS